MSLQITAPSSGTHVVRNTPFDLSLSQQLQSGPLQGYASTQFSNDPSGPWQTSRQTGGGGAITVDSNPVQWSRQLTTWTLPDVRLFAIRAYVRVAVWEDWSGGEPVGQPFLISDNTVLLQAEAVAEAGAGGLEAVAGTEEGVAEADGGNRASVADATGDSVTGEANGLTAGAGADDLTVEGTVPSLQSAGMAEGQALEAGSPAHSIIAGAAEQTAQAGMEGRVLTGEAPAFG